MADRIGHIHARSKNCDRGTAGFQCRPVNGCVDAARHPTYDYNSGTRQRPCDGASRTESVCSRVASSDNRDHRLSQRCEITDSEEGIWYGHEIEQGLRIFPRARRNGFDASRNHFNYDALRQWYCCLCHLRNNLLLHPQELAPPRR